MGSFEDASSNSFESNEKKQQENNKKKNETAIAMEDVKYRTVVKRSESDKRIKEAMIKAINNEPEGLKNNGKEGELTESNNKDVKKKPPTSFSDKREGNA